MDENKAKRVRAAIGNALNASALVGAPAALDSARRALEALGYTVTFRAIGRGASAGWRIDVRPGGAR